MWAHLAERLGLLNSYTSTKWGLCSPEGCMMLMPLFLGGESWQNSQQKSLLG